MDNVSKKIDELELRVLELEKKVKVNPVPSTTQKRNKVSVVEFLREKKPKTGVDKALLFAVYYENNNDAELFNVEDILTLWRQAKEPKPSNINDLIQKNVKKGTLAEDATGKDGKKAWFVTNTGVELMDSGFTK